MSEGTHFAVSDSGRCNKYVPYTILVMQEGVACFGHVRFDDFQREGEEGGADDEVTEENLNGLVTKDATNSIDDLLCSN